MYYEYQSATSPLSFLRCADESNSCMSVRMIIFLLFHPYMVVILTEIVGLSHTRCNVSLIRKPMRNGFEPGE